MAEKTSSVTIAAVASFITAAATVTGAVTFIDNRYAHASAVEKKEAETKALVKQQTLEIQRQSQMIRRSIVEDKIFELDAKRETAKDRRLTPVEEAQYKRYARQLDELNKALPTSGNPL